MDGPESEQLPRLQAEIPTRREAVQLLTRSTQLRVANAAAIHGATRAGLTVLALLCNEPRVFGLRELYAVHRDKPGLTTLYRKGFQSASESFLSSFSCSAYSLSSRFADRKRHR